jgi:hypothetical protein
LTRISAGSERPAGTRSSTNAASIDDFHKCFDPVECHGDNFLAPPKHSYRLTTPGASRAISAQARTAAIMENGMVTAPNLNCPPSWKARQKLITGTSAGAPVGRHRMPAQSAFGKQTVIDQASRVHLRVAWLCGMVLFLEGYDIAAVGYAIPALVDTWRITASGFTPALAAGNVGLLLVSLSAGLLGDRLGRKPVLISCVVLFGVFSLLDARVAQSAVGVARDHNVRRWDRHRRRPIWSQYTVQSHLSAGHPLNRGRLGCGLGTHRQYRGAAGRRPVADVRLSGTRNIRRGRITNVGRGSADGIPRMVPGSRRGCASLRNDPRCCRLMTRRTRKAAAKQESPSSRHYRRRNWWSFSCRKS